MSEIKRVQGYEYDGKTFSSIRAVKEYKLSVAISGIVAKYVKGVEGEAEVESFLTDYLEDIMSDVNKAKTEIFKIERKKKTQ